jgi:large subunit ribosomal protein L35
MARIKFKTHKGTKKRFRVSANGKVSHKRCGSSHLNSHKSGKRIRRLRHKKNLKVLAEAKRLRRALQQHEGARPAEHEESSEQAAAGATEPVGTSAAAPGS